MLPSLGLFKGFTCPFYDCTSNGSGQRSSSACVRPYCHFKHVRRDEKAVSQIETQVPEYKPTPKLLPLPTVVRPRPKLEYQPEKPALNASPSKPALITELQAPIYIPASCNIDKDVSVFSSSDCEGDVNGIVVNDDLSSIPKIEQKEGSSLNAPAENTEHIEKDEETKSKENNETQLKKDAKRFKSHLKYVDDKAPQENKEARTFATGKLGSKEKSKDKKSKKERYKGKHREEKKSTSSKHTLSSSRISDCKSNEKKYHKSSNSSSSSKHQSFNSVKKQELSKFSVSEIEPTICRNKIFEEEHIFTTESTTTGKFCLESDSSPKFDSKSEDVIKECEMIYDELEQQFASLHEDNACVQSEKPNSSPSLKRKPSFDDEHGASITQKKRVAYENADMKKSQPLTLYRPNHVKNAMQSIYHRQAKLHHQKEEEALKRRAAVQEAEEKVRDATDALRKAKEESNLTPLIPKIYLTPPTRTNSRTITPVANMLALERAKKKVEELKAEKRQAFTPTQTTKGTRLAHKTTAASETKDTVKTAKPPVLEANATKISFNIRMQYYEMMAKHCMAIYPNTVDAWERAQAEELAVFKKCNTVVIYKSSALLTINKLRKEAIDSGNKSAEKNKMVSHEVILAGKLAKNNSWSVQKKMKNDLSTGGEPFDKMSGSKAYDMVYELRLTDEQLLSNGFPRPGKIPGTAVISTIKPIRRPNNNERYCSRCGKVFNLALYEESCLDQCNYHPKSAGYRRGFADNHHRCCQQPAGTPGCTYANYHVTDYDGVENLTGYVTTIDKDDDYISTKKDIFALDCEMCYTTCGIELTRVTVVDINARTVYDALVKPQNQIVDYNTIYSGITEQMLQNETRTLRDVQALLMSMFHSKTILVGHSLESDLKALKIIHGVVVDTSVLYPHKMGPPKKRALKTLCIENLKRIIQENESGHDSAEDAEVCIHLVKFYLRNKIS